MKRTSISDPLKIADLSIGPGLGKVGITFCPGKYDEYALTGSWDRNLSLDLDAIRTWGAHGVISLVEKKELISLRVDNLEDEVRKRGMLWFHLPIVDGSIPDERFERQWKIARREIESLIRQGQNLVVHCRGGLGRAGTISARILVEMGIDPLAAITKVRSVRPGAIETTAQEQYVLGLITSS